MEDENGLELSLGLSFGGSSSKFKVKDVPSDPKGDEGSASKLMGSNVVISDESFKTFFKSGLENPEPKGKQKSDFITQPQESFFTDLASMTDCSNDARNNLAQFTRYQEQLVSSNRTIETEEEKSGSGKRKLPFEEIDFQKMQENLVDYVEKQGAKKFSGAPLRRNPHVSITTEDGSTGENEDVAESEAEAPQSWFALQGEENAKCSLGLKEPSLSGKESNFEYGKPTFGIPFSFQPLKVPYPVPATVPSTSSVSNTAGFPSSCVMQLMPIASGERPAALAALAAPATSTAPAAPAANANSAQLAFGYPSAQLPTLEVGSSWAFNSQPLQISSFTSRERSIGVQIQQHFEDGVKTSQGAAPHNTPATFSYDGKTSDLVIGSAKYVAETAISARSEDQGKSRNNSMRANESMNIPATEEGFFREAAAIRPGIAPNLRFGGCGSYPDLPWVTTTGEGPNGRTISGVTYKYNQNQIKIVCACHGTHMSPEEFVQHASSDALNSENNPNSASFPTTNTTNSAQS